jgi:thiamine biosynthesis lipoprotein
MVRERFRAMGTTISLLLPAEQAGVGAPAVRDLFARWEGTLSRFLPESELSALNGRAGVPVPVSPLLFDVVATAVAAAQATNGLFDPALLHQMTQLGYDRSFETLPLRLPGNFALAWPGGGWRGIVLDPERRRITLPRGVGLDLGGIAKGMAVDAALDHLQALGIDTALVNAGGDLAVRGLPLGGEAESWPIRVPQRDGTWTISLHHGTLATSGVARRRWRQGDEERHHLLDPRSGLSTHNGVWSVSVAADRCVQAEVAAKVACILGPSVGAAFLTAQGLSGVLVQESGEWDTAGSWPASPEV